MTPVDAAALAGMFRHFAHHEFHGYSPLYERMALLLADRPDLARPLLAAGPAQRRAILYLAAVQYLLRTSAHGHPLAAYLPTLGGTRTVDDDLATALADLVSTYRDELAAICATRTTQTNEARRAALLRPGFGRVTELVGGRPIHLVELGSSAGLLLISDRYPVEYTGPDGRHERYGPAGPPALTMRCEVAAGWPDPAAVDPRVAGRVGVDLHPVDAGDPAATEWLRSCVWPEQTERLVRLDAALAEVARVRPRLVTGDMVGSLPGLLAEVDDDVVPCVFASNAVTYLSGPDLGRLVEILARTGARRDLAVVLNEASAVGAELFLGRRPEQAGPPGVLAVGLLTVVVWRGGRAHVEVLARTSPHGQRMAWDPCRYDLEPPAGVGQ
ncbi:MAG TPA: DUF2332 domain-containing protein [Micromonospora sp.]